MNVKKIWMSKTFWVNVACGVLVIVEKQMGLHLVSPDVAAMGLAAINVALRFVTKTAVTLT